jgi:hypothetical protein
VVKLIIKIDNIVGIPGYSCDNESETGSVSMSRKAQRVKVNLNTKGIMNLPIEEIKVILRGADGLIASGGRTLLAKILKGSRDKKVLELNLGSCPVYGYYQRLSIDEITAKIDWLLIHDFLAIEYNGRLPFSSFALLTKS